MASLRQYNKEQQAKVVALKETLSTCYSSFEEFISQEGRHLAFDPTGLDEEFWGTVLASTNTSTCWRRTFWSGFLGSNPISVEFKASDRDQFSASSSKSRATWSTKKFSSTKWTTKRIVFPELLSRRLSLESAKDHVHVSEVITRLTERFPTLKAFKTYGTEKADDVAMEEDGWESEVDEEAGGSGNESDTNNPKKRRKTLFSRRKQSASAERCSAANIISDFFFLGSGTMRTFLNNTANVIEVTKNLAKYLGKGFEKELETNFKDIVYEPPTTDAPSTVTPDNTTFKDLTYKQKSHLQDRILMVEKSLEIAIDHPELSWHSCCNLTSNHYATKFGPPPASAYSIACWGVAFVKNGYRFKVSPRVVPPSVELLRPNMPFFFCKINQQGFHSHPNVLVDNEDYRQECLSYLRSNITGVCPSMFRKHLNVFLIPRWKQELTTGPTNSNTAFGKRSSALHLGRRGRGLG